VDLSPSHNQILKEDSAYPEALIGRGTAYAFKRELHSAIADFTKVFMQNIGMLHIDMFPQFISRLRVVYLRLYNIIQLLVRHGRGEVRLGQPWGSLLR
jgi:hypothetical protein